MTSLLPARPAPRARPVASPPPTPLTTSAIAAAVRAAFLGLVGVGLPVILAWATAAHTGASAGEAVRAALQVWLVAHHIPLHHPQGTFALVPLGLLALPLLLLVTGGRRAARNSRPRDRKEYGLLLAVFAGSYAVVAAAVAALAQTPQIRVAPWLAGGIGLLLAAVVGGLGMVHEGRRWYSLRRLVPEPVAAAAPGAVAGAALVLAGGGVLGAVAVGLHAGRIGRLTDALEPGIVGGVALLVLCVLYVPNAIVAAAAVPLGPGFAVGHGTSVTLAASDLGGVPALPLLGALPATGPLPWPVATVVVIPVLAGIGSALVTLGHRAAPSAGRAALTCGAAGAAAGVPLGLLAALAGGPLAAGRLADVGPSPWQVALAGALELGAVAAATGWSSSARPLTLLGRRRTAD